MKIKVLRLGAAAVEVDLPDGHGACVRHAIEAAAFPAAGYAISLNGAACGLDTAVLAGDLVCMVPKVEGAVRPE